MAKSKEGTKTEEQAETPAFEATEDEKKEARNTALKARYAKKPKKAPAKK